MLSGIKRELSDIRHALLALDDSKLSIDDLRAISRQLPTAEEVRQSLSIKFAIQHFIKLDR